MEEVNFKSKQKESAMKVWKTLTLCASAVLLVLALCSVPAGLLGQEAPAAGSAPAPAAAAAPSPRLTAP
ncbi:MAG: hypothetical protein ACM3NO_06015, partial [Deltaproteobacteria bacterium]